MSEAIIVSSHNLKSHSEGNVLYRYEFNAKSLEQSEQAFPKFS